MSAVKGSVTYVETLKALREVVAENPRARNRLCHYVNIDAARLGYASARPECIVGHVLHRLDLFQPDELDDTGCVEEAFGYFSNELGFDADAINLLSNVQNAADAGSIVDRPPQRRTWEQALAEALQAPQKIVAES